MGKIIYTVEKAFYLVIGFIVVIWILSFFKIWSMDMNRYFIFVGDWESVIVVVIVAFVVTMILEKLWKMEVRQIFKPKKRRKR